MTEGPKKGIVSSIRLAHNPMENVYTVIADRAYQLKSTDSIEVGDAVEIKGQRAHLAEGKPGSGECDASVKALEQKVDLAGNAAMINLKDKPYGDAARAMMPGMQEAATTLINGFISGVPISVRFHNDGDGSAGAIALYRAFSALEQMFYGEERRVSWQMNRGIGYTLESFRVDRMLFESYRSAGKPIVVITDFGTSPESEEAIGASEGKCDLIWFDHHVTYPGFPKGLIKHYMNVLDFGGESDFTAGLLTCIFSELLCGRHMHDLEEASLVSDYSRYADFKNQKAVRDALILDFLTSRDDGYSKPRQMDAILTDKTKSADTFMRASATLEEAMDAGIRNIRNHKTKSGTNICVLDFGHIAKLNLDYPLPGRYSSKLQDRMESLHGGRTITIVHYGSYISIRVSRDISDSVNLLALIGELKDMSGGSISGGGHKQAASIKTAKEEMGNTMRLLLIKLGARPDE